MIKNKNNNGIKPKDDGLLELIDVVPTLGEEANLQLASPDLVNYYKARKDRTIWLTEEITDTLYNVAQLIYEWNKEDNEKGLKVEERKPIKLIIASPGGDLFASYALVDMMKLSKTKIVCINLSYCYSAAALILIHGHEKVCLNNSYALLHNGASNFGNMDFNSQQEAQKNYSNIVKRLQDMIIEKTKIPKATLTKKLKQGDWYLDSKEQLSYGLVDRIVTDLDEIL